MNPSQKLVSKSELKQAPEEAIVKEVAKRPKVAKMQPMLPENRQRFEDLVAESPVTKASSTVASFASMPVDEDVQNKNESPDAECQRLKKENEMLKLKAENVRLQQEIAIGFDMETSHHGRHSYPPLAHHRGHENFGYHCNSYPPLPRHCSRPPPPPPPPPFRPRPSNHHPEHPPDHGRYCESDHQGCPD